MELTKYPPYLNLELTAKCNKKCSFCPTQIDPLYKRMGHSGHISLSLIEDIVKELPLETQISFHKDGEVLLYPELEAALDLTINHFTHFCTNGILLDKYAHILIGKVDLITLSVLDEENTSNGANQQVVATKKFLEKLNSQEHTPKKTRLNVKTFSQEMFEKWTQIHDDVFMAEIHNWGGDYPVEQAKALEDPICPALYNKMAINFDGTVSPCCLDYKHLSLVGDATKETVAEIWAGEKMMELRNLIEENRLNETSICEGCSFLCNKEEVQPRPLENKITSEQEQALSSQNN
jgi:radical SAM protein with 4Fe4S-binding SPASM domain